ncbi:MAG: fatty acid--CoA ligase family protein, partial [Planctomycetota bacterium]|nr:fatty acid--CoA ligase family protein [Planctomycetota bacterium]
EPLSQLIGMTECEGYCLRHPGTPLREGSAGTPRVGVEVRVVDEQDRPLPPDRIGELCIRSASMTTGYWNDEAHTREAIRDGWLHSGDQGRIDEDGNVWFVGRSKEIIVKRGSNIAPGEVESVLDQHPDIAESAVVGTPPGPHGQRVVAFVETEPGRELDVPETRDWAAERIAAFKVPDEWVVIDQLPRNPVGKLDRAELHRRCTERFPAE